MRQQVHWITHALHRSKLRLQVRSLRGWVVVLVVVALAGALQLYQASQAAGYGREIERLKARQAQLERDNAELEAEVTRLRDSKRLEQRARELGFIPATSSQVEYLVVDTTK